jgi:ATP-dependent DNA ligase
MRKSSGPRKPGPFDKGYCPNGTYSGTPGNDDMWKEAFNTRIGEISASEILKATSAWTVLGLTIGCTQEEVQASFRRLIKIHHPDKGGNRQTFEEIKAAYDVIMPQAIKSINTSVLPQLPNVIDEDDVQKYLDDPEYGMQEKYDGKHVTVKVNGKIIQAFNKKGQRTNIPQAIEDSLLVTGVSSMVVDGEVIGSKYILFDILEWGSTNLRFDTYLNRYRVLSSINRFGNAISVGNLYIVKEAKQKIFDKLKKDRREGVVFKKLNSIFRAGRPNEGGDFLKFKFWSSCSVIVIKGRDGKSSVGVALWTPTGLEPIGNVTIAPSARMPQVGEVIEVKYLYIIPGGSLYQPSYLGIRDDVDPEECLEKQLKYKNMDDYDSCK